MKIAERWEVISDWLNTDITVRRIDIGLAIAGIFCVGYYAYYEGLPGALLGGLVYIFVLMVALWVL